jgi:hypothetical protein
MRRLSSRRRKRTRRFCGSTSAKTSGDGELYYVKLSAVMGREEQFVSDPGGRHRPRLLVWSRTSLRCLTSLLWLTTLLLAQSAHDQAARILTGTVVKVIDGDTIHVCIGDRIEKVHYIGMNAPELHHPTLGEQPGGREAAEANSQARAKPDRPPGTGRAGAGPLRVARLRVPRRHDGQCQAARAGVRASHDDSAQHQASGRVLEAPAAGSCTPAWAVEGRGIDHASFGTVTDATHTPAGFTEARRSGSFGPSWRAASGHQDMPVHASHQGQLHHYSGEAVSERESSFVPTNVASLPTINRAERGRKSFARLSWVGGSARTDLGEKRVLGNHKGLGRIPSTQCSLITLKNRGVWRIVETFLGRAG